MPIYAYRCAACGHAKDVLQKMSDSRLTVCPACGAPEFVKQLTAAGFQLKGSGWYVTDFRGDAKAKEGKPAEGAADDAKGGTPKAGESSPGDTVKADAGGAEASKGAGPAGAAAPQGNAKAGTAPTPAAVKTPAAPAVAAPKPGPAAPAQGSK